MLFCNCCREILPIRGTVSSHCTTDKHLEKKDDWKNAEGKRQQILTHKMDFKAQTPVVGMTNISDRERLFRYDVLFSFLASGDPLESINAHRKLFEKYATHLSDLIPMVLAHEIIAIKNEIGQSKVHIFLMGQRMMVSVFACFSGSFTSGKFSNVSST